MFITVAICTWNRSKLLNRTLEQMMKLVIPGDVEWELIIVNNNCTDDTKKVVSSFRNQLPIREYFEPIQGLSNARNLALRESKGDYIIWADDDVLVDSNWFLAYRNAFVRWKTASAFGGKILPQFEKHPPKWLSENIQTIGSYFALLDLSDSEIILDHKRVPFGANMAFRKAALYDRQFDVTMGLVGERLSAGEESQVFRNLISEGHTVVWVPDAVVRHFLPQSRLKAAYIRKRCFFQAYYRPVESATSVGVLFFGVPWQLIKKWLIAEVRYLVTRVFNKSEHWLPQLIYTGQLQGEVYKYRKRLKIN